MLELRGIELRIREGTLDEKSIFLRLSQRSSELIVRIRISNDNFWRTKERRGGGTSRKDRSVTFL